MSFSTGLESSKQRITIKPSAAAVSAATNPTGSMTLAPSIASGQPIIIRAKVSGSARPKTQSSTMSSNGTLKLRNNAPVRSNIVPDAAVRSPSPTKFTIRSPSPSKFMRPVSPTKSSQQIKSTARAPVSMSQVALRSARAEKTSSSITTMFDDKHVIALSAPSSPIPNPVDIVDTSNSFLKTNSNSLRVKAKVTNSVKPTSQILSTMVSLPPPPSTSPAILSPMTVTPGRTRLRTMTTTRRPSIKLSSFQSRPLTVDEPRLIPLPTSPPTSNLSFSSHSSTSISSVPSHITNDVETHTNPCPGLPSQNNPTNSKLHTQFASEYKLSRQELTHDVPSRQLLVARVRADTQISVGSGRTSGSGVSDGRHSPSVHHVEDDIFTKGETMMSDDDDNITHRPKTWHSPSQEREDEERAEARSNRKALQIADLEITTKSLLVINASLEATKVRQAREIRELRRRLREARLALPPKRYKLLSEEDPVEDDKPKGDDDGGESTDNEEGVEEDECFQRINHIIESMLTVGRNALAMPAPSLGAVSSGSILGDHAEGDVFTTSWDNALANPDKDRKRGWKHGVAIGNRVLTAEEAKEWTEDTDEDVGEGEGEGENENEDIPENELAQLSTSEEEEEVEKQIKTVQAIADDAENTPDEIDVPS